ncbi:MAG: hypothetical protein D6767_05210 [Candidatus Hydrogenedentota bacterium]|nr:MAG: hypothetical protein D6767_05210 [Candidatus Hydrogenedentota bacterium]
MSWQHKIMLVITLFLLLSCREKPQHSYQEKKIGNLWTLLDEKELDDFFSVNNKSFPNGIYEADQDQEMEQVKQHITQQIKKLPKEYQKQALQKVQPPRIFLRFYPNGTWMMIRVNKAGQVTKKLTGPYQKKDNQILVQRGVLQGTFQKQDDGFLWKMNNAETKTFRLFTGNYQTLKESWKTNREEFEHYREQLRQLKVK